MFKMKYLKGTQCIYTDETPSLKKYAGGGDWKDGTDIKSIGYFSTRCRFYSQNSHWVSRHDADKTVLHVKIVKSYY